MFLESPLFMAVSRPAFNPGKQALADLRAEIDQIDGALHDLLCQRADVVDELRKVKGKTPLCLRPGREAQILRALAARPQGKLPEGLVTRLWREMLSAFAYQEKPFKVAVFAPEKGPDLWDMARDHFGMVVPLIESPSALAALSAVQEEKAALAVLPPLAEGKDAWWPLLVADKTNPLMIFATLPFEPAKAGRSNARRAMPQGFVVGRLYPELTGDDRSFLSLQCSHVPEAEMKRLFGKAGYKVRQMFMQATGRAASAPSYVFAEVDGYVGRADTRLSRLKAMMGSRLLHLAPTGGYAVPLKGARRA